MRHLLKNILFLIFIYAAGNTYSQVEPPVLQSVGVINEAGDVEIKWLPSPDPNVEGYIVYEYIGDFQGINTIQLDVINTLQTSYLAINTQANARSVSYVIAAFRMENGDTIRSALTDPKRTVFIHVDWDVCKTRNVLQWNSYTGWGGDLAGYEVSWYLQGESNIQNEARVLPPVTTFVHTNPPLNQNVCYFITANHSQGLESFSNRRCTATSALIPPAYIHAAYATVNENNHIEIAFYPDPDSQTDYYELYRSPVISENFELLAGIYQFPPSVITFTDELASTEQIHYYKLKGLNECNIPVVESNIASNIHLQITHTGGVNSLAWNAYETWPEGVQEYRVYRFTGEIMPVWIGTVDSNTLNFRDEPSLSLLPGQNGQFCYYILAREGQPNLYGFQSESASNRSCEISEPTVYIPNAFTPDGDGINDEFTVFFTYVPKNYRLIIYDRWRNIVFESRDAGKHWTGNSRRGGKAPEGIYKYVLIAETQSGRKIQKTGQVALIYP